MTTRQVRTCRYGIAVGDETATPTDPTPNRNCLVAMKWHYNRPAAAAAAEAVAAAAACCRRLALKNGIPR